MNVKRAFTTTYVHGCDASNEDFANLYEFVFWDFGGDQCNLWIWLQESPPHSTKIDTKGKPAADTGID